MSISPLRGASAAPEDDALRLVLAHARDAPPSCGPVHVIGIDGRSGAGKTSLAREVAAAWPAALVSMDSIYPGWEGLAAATGELVAAWMSYVVSEEGQAASEENAGSAPISDDLRAEAEDSIALITGS